VHVSELNFLLATGVPGTPDRYLTYSSAREDPANHSSKDRTPLRKVVGGGGKMHGRVQLTQLKIAPPSDALMLLPISADYLRSVRQVRKHMMRLHAFQQKLCQLDPATETLGKKSKMAVLATVDQFFASVKMALSELVLNCTIGQVFTILLTCF